MSGIVPSRNDEHDRAMRLPKYTAMRTLLIWGRIPKGRPKRWLEQADAVLSSWPKIGFREKDPKSRGFDSREWHERLLVRGKRLFLQMTACLTIQLFTSLGWTLRTGSGSGTGILASERDPLVEQHGFHQSLDLSMFQACGVSLWGVTKISCQNRMKRERSDISWEMVDDEESLEKKLCPKNK